MELVGRQTLMIVMCTESVERLLDKAKRFSTWGRLADSAEHASSGGLANDGG